MRILFLTNVFPSPLHPTKGPFNGALVRGLARQHTIHVVAPVAWSDKWRARFGQTPFSPTDSANVESHGWTVEHPTFYFPPKMLRHTYGTWLWRSIRSRLFDVCNTFRPEGILSYWIHPDGQVAVRLAQRLGVPNATMVGGSDLLQYGRSGKRRKPIVDTLLAADNVITVSEHLAHEIRQVGVTADRVHVIRRGVDETRFQPGSQSEARDRLGINRPGPVLVTVARFVPVKGLTVLMEACRQLRDSGREFTCYVLGDGSDRSRLEGFVGQHGLDQQVRLPGAQTQDALPDWYRAADLTVLPSLSEGVPNVLLESMACGTPFVASAVGGVPEIADPVHDRLVPPGDAAALAAAIGERLGRPSVMSARRFVPYSWEESARRVHAVLAGDMEGGNGRQQSRSLSQKRLPVFATSELL